MPKLRLGYFHEFEDDGRVMAGRFVGDPGRHTFLIPTDDPDRDYLSVGLDLTAAFEGGTSAYIAYDVDLERDDLDLYLITAGLRVDL